MFTCPLVKVALVAHQIIDGKPLVHERKQARSSAVGEFKLPSGLSVWLAPSLEHFKKAEWEKIIPKDKFFLQWDYLLEFEKNAPANLTFHYGILSDGKKTLAAFYFQVVYLSADEIAYILQPITSGSKLHSMGLGLREWLKKCREDNGFRMLVCGNNFISGEYGVAIAGKEDPAKVFLALAETVKTITYLDRTPGKISAILVKDYFKSSAREAADALSKKRYHRFVVEPEMIVPLSEGWEKFDDYISAMSKKYRNRAKAVLRKTEALEVIELEGENLEAASPDIFQLYHHVFERAKFRLSMLSENYFTEMKKKFPESFRIFGYRLDGKWVAFRSAFHLEHHLEAHFIGIDYTVNEKLPLYQRVLYDFIAEGIQAGYPQVFLGRTAAEMKSTVGAVPHDLVCYIRHRNGLSNQVIRPFIDYLRPSSWVPRNPFREESGS